MTDRLKHYIDNNLDAFNDLEPPKNAWDQLSSKIESRHSKKHQIIKYSAWISAAAVISFIVMLAPLNIWNSEVDQLTSLPEVAETEAYYNLQVNQKRNQIYQLAGQHPALKQEMDNDLAELDSLLIEIKNDLNDDVSNTEVVDAMIQNYRMKLMILEDIMSFLETRNQDNKKTEIYEL